MRGALTSMPTLTELIAASLQRVAGLARARPKPQGVRDGSSVAAHGGCGHVFLVGAGPGDAELLTLKALRALQEADVILHDQLVAEEIVALGAANAERVDVGKKGYGRACRQSDINALMVGLARAGRRVVRLKAGDPLMFGRLEEEVAALEDAGIGYTIVPGISAAQGAASALGIGLTRRSSARRFQAITGHAAEGRLPDDFDWSGVADPKATTAVYMPKATLGALCAEVQRRGLPADHPAVAVFNATRADQQVIAGTIATLPGRIAAAKCEAPCIVLIGAGGRVFSHKVVAREPAAAAVRV